MKQPIKFHREVLKVVKPTNIKGYYKTLGTSVINSQLSPLSLRSVLLNNLPELYNWH